MKEVRPVGSRGTIFTFDDNISVYLIRTANKWFLCDTHLGPLSMEDIQRYVTSQAEKKEMILFNSHSDWDHIWGNCAFAEAIIIGHETCRKRMAEIGEYDLVRLTEYHRGNINLVLPNVTFSDKLIFEEDEVEFIYAPGHTVDSAVCFDRKDSVLFVGDLVEYPIPYLDFGDLEVYIQTLDFIKQFPAKVKLSSHSGIIDNTLIDTNITYINAILCGNPVNPGVYRECPNVHNFNVNNRLFVTYEKKVREKVGANFNYAMFKGHFENLEKVSYTALKEALDRYFEGL
jgi:glyoxylase-like metal-dependent hydrolase (beta-lactamase superfamily II)